jgi:hypothetical protein
MFLARHNFTPQAWLTSNNYTKNAPLDATILMYILVEL